MCNAVLLFRAVLLRAGVISTRRIVVKTTELTDNTVPPTGGQPGTQKHGVCERNVHHNESDKLSAKCSRAGVGAMKLVLATSSTVSRLGIAHTETLENAAVVVVCNTTTAAKLTVQAELRHPVRRPRCS